MATERIVTTDLGIPPKHYLLVMDDLWKVLGASEQMAYFVDSLTRLKRGRVIGQIMITHTMNDFKLSSEMLTGLLTVELTSGFTPPERRSFCKRSRIQPGSAYPDPGVDDAGDKSARSSRRSPCGAHPWRNSGAC